MNVNSLITKDYRKKDDFAVQKNKPNSNPTTVFLRKSAWGRLTAESLGLLITQGIATAFRSDDGLVEAVRSRKISDIKTDILRRTPLDRSLSYGEHFLPNRHRILRMSISEK